MANSFFFLQAEEGVKNSEFITNLQAYSDENNQQIYVIDKPLGDSKYSYEYKDAIVLLAPKHKIMFIDFGGDEDAFDEYVEDFLEDLGSISDKFRYKNIIGRPRSWRDNLITEVKRSPEYIDVTDLILSNQIAGGEEQKRCELLISLLTGSINDIDKVKGDVPDNILDKIKQKILLFDGDQTRFVYQESNKSKITIQGLSGTGKTELLLHKLKEIYVSSDNNKIALTCHNKILADNLRKRLPDFFNFMKVEQQIKWNERLWCVNAWGSQSDKNSGVYSYICNYYNIAFHRYSHMMSFDRACQLALEEIKTLDINSYAFDYMMIDESQDFPESFFELCAKVTKSTVYIAGDVFQSIFDEKIVSSIEPDFLLSKCYRTDPKTLMFAHAIGMGLFESPKLRWLEDDEWKACGYIVNKNEDESKYYLSREPLRRFEDLKSKNLASMELVETSEGSGEDVESKILKIIHDIRSENPTVLADDIGVIFIDSNKATYYLADKLEISIPREFDWDVNLAYETKIKVKDALFVSNINNVKGLEFPFVVCVSDKITNGYNYRNALYMMLTRSFIKTYLLLSRDRNSQLIGNLSDGLNNINSNGFIDVTVPSGSEQERIKTTIKYSDAKITHFDFVNKIFDELGILPIFRTKLYDIVKSTIGDVFDYDNAKEIIEFNHKKMSGE